MQNVNMATNEKCNCRLNLIKIKYVHQHGCPGATDLEFFYLDLAMSRLFTPSCVKCSNMLSSLIVN